MQGLRSEEFLAIEPGVAWAIIASVVIMAISIATIAIVFSLGFTRTHRSANSRSVKALLVNVGVNGRYPSAGDVGSGVNCGLHSLHAEGRIVNRVDVIDLLLWILVTLMRLRNLNSIGVLKLDGILVGAKERIFYCSIVSVGVFVLFAARVTGVGITVRIFNSTVAFTALGSNRIQILRAIISA